MNHRTPTSTGRIGGLGFITLLSALAFGVTFAVMATPALAAAPTATLEAATGYYTSATVSGKIDPGSQEVSFYAEARVKGSGGGWIEQFVEAIPAEAGSTPVSAEIHSLEPETEYEVRLDAFTGGTEYVSAEPFPIVTTKAVAAPIVSLDPVSGITPTSAHFTAHVNPNAPEAAPASAPVEAAFEDSVLFECTPACNDANGSGLQSFLPADNKSDAVEADAANLLPGTKYELTLVVRQKQERNQTTVGPITFTTPAIAPTIVYARTSSIGSTSALLTGSIVPNGKPTSYFVEYGTTTAYGNETQTIGPVGSDNSEHEVFELLEGLSPSTTYHWRLVASNEIGPTYGPDRAFTTFPAGDTTAHLADGRAYEQASSPEKGGAFPSGKPGLVQAAPEGDATTFYSEPTLPGSEGAQDFGTYLAARSSENWATTGFLPPASLGREGRVLGWTDDLKYSYVASYSTSEERYFLYQRDNQTRELTKIPQPRGLPPIFPPSNNDGRLLFESESQALPEAQPGNGIFFWDKDSGAVRLASVLNSGEAPEEGAVVGAIADSGFGLERFGYKGFAVSPSGESVYFTSLGNRQIYLRRNIGRPQSPIDGEGNCTVAQDACTFRVNASRATIPDPNSSQPAILSAASTTGVPTAFFLSSEKLTDDATTGPNDEGLDLYRWRAGPSGEELIDLVARPGHAAEPNGAEVRGVLGASADGKRIYFVANGALAGSATPGNCPSPHDFFAEAEAECNLYLWEEGAGLTYIARLTEYNGNQFGYANDSQNWLAAPSVTSESRTARVSEDGKVLVFRSRQQLTGYENEGVAEFYRYEAGKLGVLCVTCSPNGTAPLSMPTEFTISGLSGPLVQLPPRLTRNLSTDGQRFFFETADALIPEDTNGDKGCPFQTQTIGTVRACQDVYEWEAPGTGSCTEAERDGGCLYLISTGTSSEPSFIADADERGDNVFFFTTQRLVSQDKDNVLDIYDARVGGGLAAQNPPFPNPCRSGDACRGVRQPVAPFATPGTSTFAGPEHAQPPACKRGFKKVKRHGKTVCVKQKKRKHKHPHKKKKHGKSARHNGGKS